MGHKLGIAGCLQELARVAGGLGQPGRAALLLAAAAALVDGCGAAIPPSGRRILDHQAAALRASLGEEVFAHAWARGGAMPMEEAITFALQ